MAKLHQVLAVEKELEKQKRMIYEETLKVLKEQHLFTGEKRTLKMFDEDRKQEENAQTTIKALTSTVMDKLQYAIPIFIKHLNCIFQKEASNAEAKADIVVNGTVLCKDVPATMLLALEREFATYRDLFKSIPTLQVGINWIIDKDLPGNIYKTEKPELTQKLETTVVDRVAYEATKEHPAQIKEGSISKQVGEYTKQVWSGKITSKAKAEILNKLELFIQATKIARAKANNQAIVPTVSMKKVFDWLLE